MKNEKQRERRRQAARFRVGARQEKCLDRIGVEELQKQRPAFVPLEEIDFFKFGSAPPQKDGEPSDGDYLRWLGFASAWKPRPGD